MAILRSYFLFQCTKLPHSSRESLSLWKWSSWNLQEVNHQKLQCQAFLLQRSRCFQTFQEKAFPNLFKKRMCSWWFKSWPFWDGENVTLLRGCWWPPTIGDQKVTLNHLVLAISIENPIKMYDLEWKTLLKWMIWGENPLFSETSSDFNWTNQFQSTPVFPTLFWGFLTWPWELPEATDAACRSQKGAQLMM